jgi:F0F1-type ATP synthase epsilon subunit
MNNDDEKSIAEAKKRLEEQIENSKKENLGLDADKSSKTINKLKTVIDILTGDIDGHSSLSEK